MARSWTRREFFKLSAASGLGAASIFQHREAHSAVPGGVLLQTVRPLRRDITSLGPNHRLLKSYADAVTAMRNLPMNDPRNWVRQAEIHNTLCPHGNWFFLPWHRAYLYYFEQICRELSGDKRFFLPYWNWSQDPQIPGPFLDPNSPLYNNTRVNNSVLPAFTSNSVVDAILQSTNFEQFASFKALDTRGAGGAYGSLEGTPHNHVHSRIGGDMGAFMAPLDPIFWPHHANIDRLWAEWNEIRGNQNTGDSDWFNFSRPGMFVDAVGNQQPFIVKNMLGTRPLGYRYDTTDILLARDRVILFRPRSIMISQVRTPADLRIRRGTPVGAKISLPPEILKSAVSVATARSQSRVARGQPASADGGTVQLMIGITQPPKDTRTFVRVFINSDDLTQQTPIDDPHYVSSFAFFLDTHRDHQRDGLVFSVDITNTLGSVAKVVSTAGQIVPQFVAVAPAEVTDAATELTIGNIELRISEIQR